MKNGLIPSLLLFTVAFPATALASPPAPAPNPDGPAVVRSTQSELRAPSTRKGLCRALRRQAGRGNRVRTMLVRDTETGRTLCSITPKGRLSIASNTKLYTTAAALDRLGPDHRLKTRVYADGEIDRKGVLRGRLYLRGAGDPSLGSGRFLDRYFGGGGSNISRLVSQVKQEAGVKRITGRVIGDASVYDGARGTADSGFATSPWVGPLSGLAFNAGYTDSSLSGFSSDPAKLATQTFTRQLRRRGVVIRLGVRMGTTPRALRSKPLAVLRSPDLTWMSRITNVYSNNYFAEMMIKGIAARGTAPATTAAGAETVRRWSAGLGAPAGIVDGSGLSRSNRASPTSIVRLLTKVRRKGFSDQFVGSLPIAGRSGTLVNRMKGTAAQDRCKAKTGTLTGVSTLSGYCSTRSGREIAFSVLMNSVTDIYRARQAQDRIAARIAGL